MRTDRRSERGVAMFICLFALLLLSAIGMALMFMGDTETFINSNFRSSQAAYYASKAGLEEARERLRYGLPNVPVGWTTITPLPGDVPAPAGPVFPKTTDARGVIYLTNPAAGETVTPWVPNSRYFDDELCHENYPNLGLPATPLTVPCPQQAPGGNWYTAINSADPNRGTNAAMPYKWVRITLKQVGSTQPYCVDGACNAINLTTPVCAIFNNNVPYEVMRPAGITHCEQKGMKAVYLVTSLAVTATGARRMTQYEVASIALPPFPAALTMDGSGPLLLPAQSNVLTVNGINANSCGAGAPDVPGIGAISDQAKQDLINEILNPPNGQPRPDNYTGIGDPPPGNTDPNPNVLNVNTPIPPNQNPPMDPQFQSCDGIHNLYNNISAVADQVITANNPTVNLGTPANPKVTVINGDFTLDSNNANGAGILIVTGTLHFQGNPPFSGIVLAIGKGAVTAAGGGNGNLFGTLFVANCFDTPNHWKSGAMLPPFFDWSNGGGTYNIQYDSCWVQNVGNRLVYKVLASREEMY